MGLLINGEFVGDDAIRQEAASLRPRVQEELDQLDPIAAQMQLWEWAQDAVVERVLLRQAAMADTEPLDEELVQRPTYDQVEAMYQKYKHHEFEVSVLRFVLASFDLDLFHIDLLSLPDHPKIFCSEYQIYLLEDLGLLTDPLEAPNEYTPKDISNLTFYRRLAPVVFRYSSARAEPD